VIEATGLTKYYGRTVAVDGLSFTVPPGQVTGFLGPNGSGKSTTMRLILGLDSPTSGSVTVNGRSYREFRHPLRQVGALLDANAMHGGRSAYNHLRWLAISNGIGRSRVNDVLDQVGLRSVADKRVGGFSLGMSQRLGIAAALLGDPSVFVFDEPVNGLDPEGVLWLRSLLKSLAAEGRTVLLSSHVMSEMAITADRLLIIGRGRLIAQTSVEELLNRGTGSFVQVRSHHAPVLATLLATRGATVESPAADTLRVTGISADAVGEIAATNALTLLELAVHQPSLEDTYMQLTNDVVDYRTADHVAVED
jgi:ABC-2 type transport system ATP-binding protein